MKELYHRLLGLVEQSVVERLLPPAAFALVMLFVVALAAAIRVLHCPSEWPVVLAHEQATLPVYLVSYSTVAVVLLPSFAGLALVKVLGFVPGMQEPCWVHCPFLRYLLTGKGTWAAIANHGKEKSGQDCLLRKRNWQESLSDPSLV